MNDKAMKTTVRRRFRRFTRKDLFELFVCIALAGLFVLLSSGTAFGQGNVGINNPTPHAKSLLDLTSSDKGLLTPRMTAAQRTAMFPAPDATGKGMLVYQTDGTQGFYYYDGTAWAMIQTGNAGWGLLGNAGTNPTTNFIGTTDNQGLAFRANNTEHMRIAPNGNVGIGYDSPNFKLDVLGTVPNGHMAAIRNLDATGLSTLTMFNHTATAQAYFGMYNPTGIGYAGTATAHPFSINTSNAERMRITAAGNVGIGTTAPARLLEVASTNQGVQRISSANAVNGSVIELLNTTAGNNLLGAINFLDGVTTRGQIGYHLTDGMMFRTGVAERMRIDANGNVGIGTTAPTRLFEVASTNQSVARLNSASTANGSVLELRNTTAGNNILGAVNFLDGIGTRGQLSYHLTNGMLFNTAGAERMRIDLIGNMGIGTSAPTEKLHVAGSIRMVDGTEGVGKVMVSDATGTASWAAAGALGWGLTGNAGTNPATNFIGTTDAQSLVMRTNNTERLHIAAAGNVGIGTSVTNVRLQVAADQADVVSNFYNANATGYAGIHYDNNAGGRAHVGFAGSTAVFWANMGYAGTASNHPFVLTTNNQERMHITAGGAVGIGTNAPAAKFDVVDAGSGIVARFNGTNNTGYSVAHWIRSDNVGAHVGFFNPGVGGSLAGNFVMGSFGNAPVSLTTNNLERLRIATDGKVGIGTTAPTSELEVNGFTKLGSNAPAIKQVEFTGTTAATEGAFVDIAHGLTASKIMSVEVLIEYTSGNWITTGYTINPEYHADYVLGATNIRLYNHNGSSGSILNKPVKVLVTYKA